MVQAVVDERDWSPLRRSVVTRNFAYLRLGPLALGPPKWSTSTGPTHLALTETDEEILLVDRMIAVRDHLDFDVGRLMDEMRHVLGLEHRHIMTIVGAGIDDEIPYVVRRFRLGRPLSEVLEAGAIDASLAVAILYPVAEALSFLADAGPRPGVCGVGDFDGRDVWIGFDGSVGLSGQGASILRKRVAGPSAPDSDLEAFRRLVEAIVVTGDHSTWTELVAALCEVPDLPTAQVTLRRFDREACGRRAALIGAWMRRHFSAEIQKERSAFGLQPLH